MAADIGGTVVAVSGALGAGVATSAALRAAFMRRRRKRAERRALWRLRLKHDAEFRRYLTEEEGRPD